MGHLMLLESINNKLAVVRLRIMSIDSFRGWCTGKNVTLIDKILLYATTVWMHFDSESSRSDTLLRSTLLCSTEFVWRPKVLRRLWFGNNIKSYIHLYYDASTIICQHNHHKMTCMKENSIYIYISICEVTIEKTSIGYQQDTRVFKRSTFWSYYVYI